MCEVLDLLHRVQPSEAARHRQEQVACGGNMTKNISNCRTYICVTSAARQLTARVCVCDGSETHQRRIVSAAKDAPVKRPRVPASVLSRPAFQVPSAKLGWMTCGVHSLHV
jgi:hypothetical protein